MLDIIAVMKASFIKVLTFATLVSAKDSLKLVLSNDDGWAVANLRREYDALRHEGYEVILSAPAVDKSGTGRTTAQPTTLTMPCEFDTCAVGAPGIGTDEHDHNLHYVNAFPWDAAQVGITKFAEERWHSKPDIFVGGTNVGTNLGNITRISGTVGGCASAAAEGVPAFGFSGDSGAHVSFTTLADPKAQSTIDANVYTKLVLTFLATYLRESDSHNSHHSRHSDPHSNPHSSRILPAGTLVNINFSNTSACANSADNFKWIATRVFLGPEGVDTKRCGSTTLPDETTVSHSGCFATVSVVNATTIDDVSAVEQKPVFDRLHSLLSCLHD